ncbi:MAG: PD40 domain-containing protein [Planctomycetes bacterium]|nr:PD40 domain-containing protein [Planctomycetota bacterium]
MSHSMLRTVLATTCTCALVAGLVSAAGGTNGVTERISLDSAGQQVLQGAYEPSISRDGQRIAFQTSAALLPTDTNGHTDIYVYDRSLDQLLLASTSAAGSLGNGTSFDAAISGDGRWVAFATHATNFVGFDLNGESDVMLKDLLTGALTRVSSSPGSAFAGSGESRKPAVSYDGRYVAFHTTSNQYSPQDTNATLDVYVRDFQNGSFQLVSRGLAGAAADSSASSASISDDGRFIAFQSTATNLVAGDTNGECDVFVRDMWGGLGTMLVSRVPLGALGNDESWQPSISASGRYVAFTTRATNFVFGDTNGSSEVYLVDRSLNVLRHVSGAHGGGFSGFGHSFEPSVSGDGRFVAFTSSAPNLASVGSTFQSSYVRDMTRGETYYVSSASGPAVGGDGASLRPCLNADGSLVAFHSSAANLVPGDTNDRTDVFLRTLYADPLTYCSSSLTSGGCEPSMSSVGLPRVSQNVGFVVTCDDVPNNKFGLFFYGFGGRQAVPFGGGTFCMLTPVVRTPVMNSGGNPVSVSDCSGHYALDFNAYSKGLLGVAPHPALNIVGQRVDVQCWGRDPQGVVATTFLSDALEFVVGP